MRQAIMVAPGIIEYRHIAEPEKIKDNEILLRIKKIGICGSDIHVYHGEHPAVQYPVVQGHEYSAVVEATGRNVTKAKPGTKATARPQLVCGTCSPCKKGQYNICKYLKVQGFQSPGVAQDLFVVPEERLVVLPDLMTFEQGAMIEPSAVGAHATRRAGDLHGKNVVISGAGTIGNLVAQFAKIRGAGKVLITDISDYRLKIAKKCGIEGVLNVSRTIFEKGVKSYFGEEGFHIGFEAAGVQASLDALISFVENGGDIIIIGVYAENPVMNMYYLGEHELNVYGSMMYHQEDYEFAVKMITAGKIITAPLITCSFPFEKFLDAYRFIDEKGHKIMKVMIDL
jgi:2-desacetyl-2-hydroxyethyl bacteriochlorophyllide A dehydrogenase